MFAVVLGLLWGSFANVCIYRWPPTDEFPEGPLGRRAGLALLRLQGADPLVRQRAAAQLPVAARPLPQLQGAVLGALPARRGADRRAVRRRVVVHASAPAACSRRSTLRLIRFAIYAAFVFVMVVITFIDIDHKLILNKVTIPSIVLFYAASLAAARAPLVRRARRRRDRLRRAVADRRALLSGSASARASGLGDACCSRWSARCSAGRAWSSSLFGGSVLGSVIGTVQLRRSRASAEDRTSRR